MSKPVKTAPMCGHKLQLWLANPSAVTPGLCAPCGEILASRSHITLPCRRDHEHSRAADQEKRQDNA